MNVRKKRRLCRFLSCLMLTTMVMMGPSSEGHATAIYSKATAWAQADITEAYGYGLIPTRLLGSDMTQAATREELCELSVKLYEVLSGKVAQVPSLNPFTDTSNEEILKAYQLGITSGTSATTFSPGAMTDREQVATMFGRTISFAKPSEDFSTVGSPTFSDQKIISTWALNHVLYMAKIGLIKGFNNNFMPRPTTPEEEKSGYGRTKREEAIAICNRAYKNFKGTSLAYDLSSKDKFIDAMIGSTGLSFTISSPKNLGSFLQDGSLYEESDFFRPTYSPKIVIKGPSGYDSTGNPTYTDVPFSVFVPSYTTTSTQFQLSLDQTTRNQTKKIVWQIAKVPFNGKAIGSISLKPYQMIASGEAAAGATTFSVNLSQLGLSKEARTHLYVRAYPVDSSGKSIGDTGSGLAIVYGQPIESIAGLSADSSQNVADFGPKLQEPTRLLTFSLVPKLLPAKRSGEVTYSGEYPNDFFARDIVGINSQQSTTYAFLPKYLPTTSQEIRVQVSLNDYVDPIEWQNPSGLVYEKILLPSDPVYKALTDSVTDGIAIDFAAFSPTIASLGTKHLEYKVRVVILSLDSQNQVKASATNTVKVTYGAAADVTYYKTVKVTPNIGSLVKVVYNRPRIERTNWQYHYVVTRQPTYGEVFLMYMGSDKDSLYPKMPVGTKLDFTPVPENKSWWEEAWDAVSGFFKDMADFFSKIVNWVSKAYADLKSGIIAYTTKYLPLSDAWKEKLNDALEAMVDYGLVSVGIPPSLPNFDELTSMGADYFTQVALDQAGIPEGMLTDTAIDGLSGAIKDQAKTSGQSGQANPMNYDFIKLDPDYLYQPANLMITLENETNRTTEPGYLYGNVVHQLTQAERNIPEFATMYAKYGTTWFTLFKPVAGLYVPSLEPGQKVTIPVFLEPYADLKMQGTNVTVSMQDFYHMYNMGNFTFDFHIAYDLIGAEDAAKLNGEHIGPAIYEYSRVRTDFEREIVVYENWSN